MRGFPYHAKGKDVDDLIISSYGQSFSEASEKFLSAPCHLFYPGFRIQGKPLSEGAKLRFVFIPTIHYQYLINGLVNYTMDYLKTYPNFLG